jgi:RsmE family RNA methyltransferase
MNMVYLARGESGTLLPPSDRRWKHVRQVLKKTVGDELFAGCEDGTVGKATILKLDDSGLLLGYEPSNTAPSLHPLRILMGFPRPIQAGRILKDLTSLGVSSIWFSLSELGEKSYAESNFFKNGEFQAHLVEGAEQSGNPLLPEIKTFWSVPRALSALESAENGARAGARIIMHPDGDTLSISKLSDLACPVTVAIGSERGWTAGEIGLFRDHGFIPARMGERILKTETAALAAASILLARMGAL